MNELAEKVLHAIHNLLPKGERINARNLVKVCGIGRDRVRKALNELVEAGHLSFDRWRNGTSWVSAFTLVRPQALWSTAPSTTSSSSISSSTRYARRTTNTTGVKTFSLRGEGNMGWEDFGFAPAETKAPAKAQARREGLQRKAKTHRSEKPWSQWDVVDVCAEFAARYTDRFPMKSWNMYQGRFIHAWGDFRAANHTSTELELKVMDLFWVNPEHYRDCNGPEHVWKKFVKMAPSLLPMAWDALHQSDTSPIDNSWEKFYDENPDWNPERSIA